MDDDLAAVVQHYAGSREEDRLAGGLAELELARTREILRRHLPPPPARILDVGGGTGVHARWLVAAGYEVHLIEVTPRHVEHVRATLGPAGVVAEVGDARTLDRPDASVDVVLLLGPLYHLPDRSDRLLALAEARRVVRPGGLVAAAAINRFASLFDGLRGQFLFDARFRDIVDGDLRDGCHVNPHGIPHGFTTAFFHHPEQLRDEVVAADLCVRDLVGVEGMAGWLDQLDGRWADEADRATIVEAARRIESEPSLLGLSAHLLVVAERP